MADAVLGIRITGDGSGGGGNVPDTEMADRWRSMMGTMQKATDDLAAKFDRLKATVPVGGTASRTSSGAGTGTPRTSAAPTGSAWSALSFKDKQAAAMSGRPVGVTDEEWEQFGKDSARSGQQQAMLAPSRAAAEAERIRKQEEERLRKQQEEQAKEREKLATARIRRREQEDAQIEANAKAQQTRDMQLAVSMAQSSQMAGGGGSGKYAQRGAAGGAMVGMMVGGPAGAAAGQLIGQEVGKKVDNPLPDTMQVAIRGLGQAAEYAASGLARVAGNDGVGLFQVAANAATEALDGIPFVGGPAKDAIKTFTQVITAANVATEAFARRARELQGYDGSIAASVARQDVTRIRADIEEAQRFGDKYARLVDKQTEFEEMMRGLLAPLKEVALEYLPKILDYLMEVIPRMLERLDHLVPGTDLLKDMAEEAKAARRKFHGPGGDVFALNKMLAAARGLKFDAPARPPAIAPLGIPLVDG